MRQYIDIGASIKKRMDEKGLKPVWLAEKLNCTSSNIFKLFKKPDIGMRMLLDISRALEFNFFTSSSQLFEEEVNRNKIL
jgi:predicted transcriptional regulator